MHGPLPAPISRRRSVVEAVSGDQLIGKLSQCYHPRRAEFYQTLA
jgi:hypothetical protein